ncbi:MAG: VanZ family protein [Lachnospiraceae bacterium]|nr:VanZ family protein [Lachnospiraceae bacterium]MBQ2406260.1 VanZ family protein [Lachnospiraceae bacterium]MEE0920735.1 VanZ family protein [Lachnospiraceae bacterium]MEE1516068.1 VanZ family protein [Lachnospiraceae bacterium]
MIKVIRSIVANVLQALYQPFWFAVIMSILITFFYMSAEENGLKVLLSKWYKRIKSDRDFRKVLYFSFITVMILFRTLLNRNMWANPLSDVIGVWGFTNAKGEFTTEAVENFILFVPFIFGLLWTFKDKLIGKGRFIKVMYVSLKYAFMFSLSIEMLQLFLRLGTFQLSDLFFNTMGGLIGGIIYYFGSKVQNKMSKFD